MSGLLDVPDLGKATSCTVAESHEPRPLRFVWHHILPQEAGGQTTPANLASLCDNCHYATHALLYYLAKHGRLPVGGSHGQRYLALEGYAAAGVAGTIDRIPDEGGITFG